MDNKYRLDVIIMEIKEISRVMAVDLIKKGSVKVDGKVVLTPGAKYRKESDIEVIEEEFTFVGRGGFKLLSAIKEFNVFLEEKACIDVGASTGGFTDCMLQFGAKKVYAVDTGTEQLSEKLKENSCIISMENTDIRNISIDEEIDFISVDISFISLEKVLMKVYDLLKEDGEAVCLIKPQFEAGKGAVNKKGILKDKKIHLKVLKNIYNYSIGCNFKILGIKQSPIEGSGGNKEYLLHLYKGNKKQSMNMNEYLNKVLLKIV